MIAIEQGSADLLKERDDYLGIRRSLAKMVANKDTHRAPGPMSNSATAYTDADRWAEERAVLRAQPLFAGFSVQIPDAGDVLIFDDAGPQIVVIRQYDGSLRAFLNMCTHRAARIVSGCDRLKRITCPFHAWTFGIDGKLTTVPGKQFFEADTLASRNLIQVPVSEWAGMIFVRPVADGKPIDIEAHLDSYAPHLAQFGMENATYIDTGRLEVQSNWKFVLDTFSEAYHLPALHSASFGLDYFPNLIHYEAFGPHHRFALANKNFRNTVGAKEMDWDDPTLAVIGFIFPNTIISMAPTPNGRHNLQFSRIFPGDAVNKAFSLTTTLALPGADSEEDLAFARMTHDSILVINYEEDYLLAADAQRNLEFAPSDFSVLYAAIEPAIQDFHRHLADATRSHLCTNNKGVA